MWRLGAESLVVFAPAVFAYDRGRLFRTPTVVGGGLSWFLVVVVAFLPVVEVVS